MEYGVAGIASRYTGLTALAGLWPQRLGLAAHAKERMELVSEPVLPPFSGRASGRRL